MVREGGKSRNRNGIGIKQNSTFCAFVCFIQNYKAKAYMKQIQQNQRNVYRGVHLYLCMFDSLDNKLCLHIFEVHNNNFIIYIK